MSGGVTLAPEAGAGARVVHSAAGLEGCNDGFLERFGEKAMMIVESFRFHPYEILSG